MNIKNRTLLFATVNFVCAKIFTYAPQSFVNSGKNSAWIMVVLNTAFSAFLFYIIFKLFEKSGNKDFLLCLNMPIRKFFTVLIFIYLLFSSAVMLRLLIQGVVKNFMPESPSLFIASFFIIPLLYAADKGINSNLSLSLIISPILAFIIVVAIVMLPYYDFSNLFPLLGKNDFYLKSFYAFNYFSDFIIFILLMPYLENKEKALKTGLGAIFVSGALCLLLVLCQILSIPKEREIFSPFYYIVTFLSGSRSPINFVKILKLIFLFNFLLYFSTSVSLAAFTAKKGFGIKYEEKLTGICAVIILLLEELLNTPSGFLNIYKNVYKYSFFVFPMIPLISYIFAKKRRKEK